MPHPGRHLAACIDDDGHVECVCGPDEPPYDPPEPEPYDPGPEVDDEGGMTEYRGSDLPYAPEWF